MLKSLPLVLVAVLPALCGTLSAQVFAERGSPSQLPTVLPSLSSLANGGNRFVAHGDFDNDGRLDLLAVATVEGVVRIARGRGDGLFASWTDVPWPAAPLPAVVGVADFDGNGSLDLMYGSSLGSGVSDLWLALGNGVGGFPNARRVATGLLASSVQPRVADVDGDGDVDAMIVAGGQVVLLRNGGAATFARQAQAGSLIGTIDGTLVSDIDADGDPDFIAGANLFENDGTGTFTATTATRFPQGSATNPTAAGDFNGDGLLDIVGGPEPEIWIQDAAGVFSPVALPRATPSVWTYAALDVDRDGDLDLVAGNIGSAPTSLLNDGNANFVLRRTLLPFAHEVDLLETVDIDGDGDLDVIADHHHLGMPRLLLSVGQPDLEDAAVPTLGEFVGQARVATTGDVDGDGDLDVVLSEAGEVRLYRNDGASRLRLVPGAIPRGFHWRDVRLGDLDGDGDPDLLAGFTVLENTGHGSFEFRTNLGITSEATLLYDLDGDGDLDILAERWYRNDGSFTFIAQAAVWNTPEMSDLELADFNGDGIDDLFVASYGSQDRLFLRTAGGAFTEVPFPGSINTLAATAVDYDHDGDVDLVLGHRWWTSYPEYWVGTRVFDNDGTGTFTDRTSAVFGGVIPFGDFPLVADFDLDGDRDILVTGDAMLFYEQTPSGFVDSSAAWTDRRYGWAILSADLDEDTDEDVILRGNNFGVAKVLTAGWRLSNVVSVPIVE